MTPLLILDASVSSPCERPTIAASLNRDLVSIDKWCAGWGMLINSAETYGMMISRSRTACLMFPDLFVGGSIVKMVGERKISGVVLDSKLTFESHVRSVAASASRRIGILWKPRSVFRDNSIVSCVVFGRLFFMFLSIALQSGCLLPLVTYHCLIGAFEVYLGLVVVLFAQTKSCRSVCSISFVVLLVIRWGR